MASVKLLWVLSFRFEHNILLDSNSQRIHFNTGLKHENVKTITLGNLPKAEAFSYSVVHLNMLYQPSILRHLISIKSLISLVDAWCISTSMWNLFFRLGLSQQVILSGNSAGVNYHLIIYLLSISWNPRHCGRCNSRVETAVSRVELELCSGNRAEMIMIIERLSLSQLGSLNFNDLVNDFGWMTCNCTIMINDSFLLCPRFEHCCCPSWAENGMAGRPGPVFLCIH